MEASHILANQEAEISGLNQKQVRRIDSLPLVTRFHPASHHHLQNRKQSKSSKRKPVGDILESNPNTLLTGGKTSRGVWRYTRVMKAR